MWEQVTVVAELRCGCLTSAASVGGIFASSCCFAAGLRDKDDSWNAAVGGAAAGSLFGVRGESSGLVLGKALKCVLCIVPSGEVYEIIVIDLLVRDTTHTQYKARGREMPEDECCVCGVSRTKRSMTLISRVAMAL